MQTRSRHGTVSPQQHHQTIRIEIISRTSLLSESIYYIHVYIKELYSCIVEIQKTCLVYCLLDMYAYSLRVYMYTYSTKEQLQVASALQINVIGTIAMYSHMLLTQNASKVQQAYGIETYRT